MSTKLNKIEGIGEQYRAKLKEAGIDTVEELLEKCGPASGRKSVAEATEISEKLLLKWVNRADLFRVNGIGEEYSDLLEIAGVDSPAELAQRNAENLYAKITEVNDSKKLVRAMPSMDQLKDWIEQAKDLPKVVTH